MNIKPISGSADWNLKEQWKMKEKKKHLLCKPVRTHPYQSFDHQRNFP
jgi:hypothetical protein